MAKQSRPASKASLKYGVSWPVETYPHPLLIEMQCVRMGGRWKDDFGEPCGEGLFHHLREMEKYLWPEDDHHRWSDMALRRITENEITVFLGSGDSGKSFQAAKYILCTYWCRPDKTLWMVSSTELRGAELRIWGAIKGLFNRARVRFPNDLAGFIIDSKHCITTDSISEDQSEARLLTRGIIFIPCKVGNQYIGMGVWAGIKPPADGLLGHCGDEVSFMERNFLDAYANWYGKENFKGLMLANPFDLDDPSCVAAEPVDGWDNWKDTEKTQEWRSKFYGAWVVAFDGRDSPNFDPPVGERPRYPYLVGPKKLNAVGETHGKDSWQYFNQCVGKPRAHAETRRVITRLLCEQHKAYDDVVWGHGDTAKVFGLDAAYGGVGGDRCVAGHLEYGQDVNGHNILCVHQPVIVPVSVRNPEEPEIQIARFCKAYCETQDIPPRNVFFDGRSTLAVRMAQEWSAEVNVVDFGGPATNRPVSQDEFVWDEEKKQRRLKLCNEHYSKFVTELWFAVYYLIISEQLRKLPKDVAKEGWSREWKYVTGNRMEVETKSDMKERTSQSPDLFDWLVTGVEGARRTGFLIERLAKTESQNEDWEWLEREQDRHRSFVRQYSLNYK